MSAELSDDQVDAWADEQRNGPRYCICADPENCTEAVPGRICKAGFSVPQASERAVE